MILVKKWHRSLWHNSYRVFVDVDRMISHSVNKILVQLESTSSSILTFNVCTYFWTPRRKVSVFASDMRSKRIEKKNWKKEFFAYYKSLQHDVKSHSCMADANYSLFVHVLLMRWELASWMSFAFSPHLKRARIVQCTVLFSWSSSGDKWSDGQQHIKWWCSSFDMKILPSVINEFWKLIVVSLICQ